MHDPEGDISNIPLSQLELSPDNVRKTPADASAFTELKASIAAHGLLENLIARAMEPSPDGPGRYAVIAGGRRLAAMQALAAEGALDEDHPVPCRMIGSIAAAEEVSLAENSVRAAMHPADQVEAFRRLADAGSTAAAIAARFGVSERTVEKRLRLGNAAPVLLEAYRAGDIDLDTLMAFAVTTDQARQSAVWETVSQQGYRPGAWQIKRLLTEDRVSATSAIARFVGIEAYEATGGKIDRDLFAEEDERGIWFDDPDLLNKLAMETLQAAARELETRWKWAEARLDVDWSATAAFGRVRPQPAEPTDQEKAEIERLRTRNDELANMDDDGSGIDDPAVLLTFGESNWKTGIAEAEDPAGFGLLALSRRGCTLRWRLPGQDSSPGYRLVLEPAHFLGRDAAYVVPEDSAPWPHGTAVTFEASEAPHAVRAFLETAARHYPLPVTIDGEVIERRAFLDGALHVEPWKGLVFGVFKDRHAGYRVPDVNFHGLTLPVRLPQIDTVEGGVWSARADIDSCPDLELVLPARKEAVETPFLEEMREAAGLAVYRAMAQADPAPRVAWTDWHKAKEAGIEMSEPPAELRPWRPAIADTDYWDERSAFTAVGSGALVMQADPEPPEAQALHRALGLAGLQDGSKPALRLFAPEPRFEGYPWYEALARVTGIETLVTVDGAVRSLDYFTNRENAGEPERPETIVMHLNVLHPPKSPRHCFRKCDTIAVSADLAFAGEAWSSVHDALPLVTADSDIAPEELAQLLRAGFFSPCRR